MDSVEIFGLSDVRTGRLVREIASASLKVLSLSSEKIKIYFVSPSEIRRINVKFRGLNKATSVLSFSSGEFVYPPEERILGEIVLCYGNIVEEAKKANHSKETWLGKLVIHGILHLAGYSHETEGNAARMQKEEERIFSLIKSLL